MPYFTIIHMYLNLSTKFSVAGHSLFLILAILNNSVMNICEEICVHLLTGNTMKLIVKSYF